MELIKLDVEEIVHGVVQSMEDAGLKMSAHLILELGTGLRSFLVSYSFSAVEVAAWEVILVKCIRR